MKRKKVLLLNPPGEGFYLRDYYCSKSAKGNFTYHPVDLLYLSGTVSKEHDVEVIDCIAEKKTRESCRNRINEISPDAIIFLTGHLSWVEDIKFMESLPKRDGCVFIGTGDLLLDLSGEKLKESDALDAVILDFTTDDILRFLRGDYQGIRFMHFKAGGKVVIDQTPREHNKEIYVPVPRFEKFPFHKYHFPFVKRRPFSTMLTDYGCPFHCSFCIVGTLGYKWRAVENVIEEMDCLKSIGVRDIHFVDQTFGANRARTELLLKRMMEKNYGFGFTCWTRVDLLDEELVRMMKKAGCHTMMMGVETANDTTLDRMKKGFKISQAKKGFRLAKEAGIRTLATYLIGLPGENRIDVMNTIDLALELDTDFASFNVLVPRINTELRQEAVERGWFDGHTDAMDQSGSIPLMGNDLLSKEEILNLRNLALVKFYRRPGYIMKRILSVETIYELRNLIYTCAYLQKECGRKPCAHIHDSGHD